MYQGKYETNSAVTEREENTPAPNPRRRPPARRKRKPRTTRGTIIFYGVYIAMILVFLIAMSITMGALKNWLVNYEASQPNVKCQQVFDELFADPDWAEIYTLAGMEDAAFEGKDAYAAHMEKTVGDTELTYIETSAGLSGDKKYIVRAGTEKVATFTLTDANKDTGEIPDWELGEVEIFFSRNMDFTIITDPGNTVTVNGVILDESHIIRLVTTTAENYLPEGVHGYRLAELHVDGLLGVPEVVVTTPQGESVELSYNEEERSLIQDLSPAAIGDEERNTLVKTAETYCRYMIGAVGASELKTCFDSSTQIYNTITTNTTWMQGYTGYDFSTATVTDYYRYSDGLYSAKVSLSLNVTRKNGSNKEYHLDSTFFMEKQGDNWKVIEMTNVDVQEQLIAVRLTYMNGDATVSSGLVDAESNKLTPPAVTAPEGKVFSGWFIETVDDEGIKTMSLAFLPDENGNVSLPTDNILEPMTLYALFEAEDA